MIEKELNYKFWPSTIKMDSIRTSLIICTYNRPGALLKLFEHLKNSDDLPDEILIIDGTQDNSSFDKLTPLLNGYDFKRDIIYVFAPTGLVIQRNAGIDISRGEILHFIDDDCLPEKSYFSEIEYLFKQNSDIGGVTGNIVNEQAAPLSLKYKIRCYLGIYSRKSIPGIFYCNGSSVPKAVLGDTLNENLDVDIASGAAMSFRKDILNQAGDFSEFFVDYLQGEEGDASLRVRRFARIVICAKAKCFHYGEPSSRPKLFKRGFMEIYNRYYLWKLYVPHPKLKCKLQFWGDVIFLHFYAIGLFVSSGFKIMYLHYLMGFIKGTLKSILTGRVIEVKRTMSFRLTNYEK